jgi:hypothetical protein
MAVKVAVGNVYFSDTRAFEVVDVLVDPELPGGGMAVLAPLDNEDDILSTQTSLEALALNWTEG